MVNKTKILSDLSKIATDAMGAFSGIKKEIETIVKLRVDKAIRSMKLVKREEFEALKKEGKLRYYGFCAFGGDPSAYHEVADKGSFHSLLVFYNILNPSSDREMPNAFSQHNYGQILKKASAKGIGAVALRVLEAGALSGSSIPHELNQGGPSSDPEYATNATRAQALDFLRSSDLLK